MFFAKNRVFFCVTLIFLNPVYTYTSTMMYLRPIDFLSNESILSRMFFRLDFHLEIQNLAKTKIRASFLLFYDTRHSFQNLYQNY